MTDAIQNGEVGSSVRAKLNENFVDVAALQAEAALSFDTVAALLADSTLTYVTAPAGTIVEAGGFRYAVAASAATDQHVIAMIHRRLPAIVRTLAPGDHVQKGERIRAANLGSSESSHRDSPA